MSMKAMAGASIGMIIFALVMNALVLGGSIWIIVKVLQWMGIL